jgi:16S rRNA processing protein RimM
MNNQLRVGKILRPRGLKGELKCDATFYNVPKVYINNQMYLVEKASLQNGNVFFKLIGIDTIEQAEKLRNKEIFIDREELKLGNDEVLTNDLIGFSVVCDGHKIGKVTSIENYGSCDYFNVARFGGVISIPNEDEFILETNMTKKQITVSKNALDEEIIL